MSKRTNIPSCNPIERPHLSFRTKEVRRNPTSKPKRQVTIRHRRKAPQVKVKKHITSKYEQAPSVSKQGTNIINLTEHPLLSFRTNEVRRNLTRKSKSRVTLIRQRKKILTSEAKLLPQDDRWEKILTSLRSSTVVFGFSL